ncbi:MAG: hypothetical protein IPN29_20090 [Saprospiraceae bacterium]|nr:hypothetical protein [Saprospiraceae bacterium]
MKKILFILWLFIYDQAIVSQNYILDPAFGDNGIIVKALGSYGVCRASVLQPDEKLVLTGNSSFGLANGDITLLRYNSDGTLDKTFNYDGIVTESFSGYGNAARDVVVQQDGNILVCGNVEKNPAGGDPTNICVVRYKSSGQLDNNFGKSGKVSLAVGKYHDSAEGMALQPDGKIVLAGYSDQNVIAPSYETRAFAIVRLNADGSPDESFSGDGKLVIDVSEFAGNEARSVAIDNMGRIVAGGFAYAGKDAFALVRVKSYGVPDASFGQNGKVVTKVNNFDNEITKIKIQPDGKILAVGFAREGTSVLSDKEAVVVRYNENGSLDNGFGEKGKAIIKISGDQILSDVDIDSSGNIIVCGYSKAPATYINHMMIIRMKTDGSLDSSFASNGVLISDFNFITEAKSIKIQENGKLVVSGWCVQAGTYKVFVARFISSVVSTKNNSEEISSVEISPNPVEEKTSISFYLKRNDTVTITLLDENGKQIQTICRNEKMSAGKHTVNLILDKVLPSGRYVLQVATSHDLAGRMVVKI